MIFGKGTTVSVSANIQNATPAVYQLESRKSNTPICLFTDFDSKTNVSDVLNDTVISSKNTVLDMRDTNSKSNGVLFWSNTVKSGCKGISDEISYYSNEGIPCNAKLIEKSFETDMNLNSQNLSVIALRILLLKVVGFNLLMTLRLWSS